MLGDILICILLILTLWSHQSLAALLHVQDFEAGAELRIINNDKTHINTYVRAYVRAFMRICIYVYIYICVHVIPSVAL